MAETLSEWIGRAGVEQPIGYRWVLGRNLGEGWFGDPTKTLLWVMLNPSTADNQRDDPTIRKCMGFTKRWGFSALTVVNLFAARATKPADLWRWKRAGVDVIGRECDNWIHNEARRSAALCVAWGALPMAASARVKRVLDLLPISRELLCVGRCQDGEPRHPLMAPYTDKPEVWRVARGG